MSTSKSRCILSLICHPIDMLKLVSLLTITLFLQAQAYRDPIRLTHGPMLGKPTSSSVAVWGRTSEPGEFIVKFGTEPSQLAHSSLPAKTEIDRDNTGVANLIGLKGDTRYHYQIFVKDNPHGLPGTFLTLPSAEESRNPKHNPKGLFNFRFEVGSCANQNPLHGIGHRSPVYENLNQDWADKTHFHIMNGDWLYEELRTYPSEAWRLIQGQDTLPPTVKTMPSIVGVWENYKLYLSRGNELAQWHRNVPSYFTFDDHELVNDIWGSAEIGKR
ncbi:alkaline phosphatase D family protein, partial [Akkermansiaceae bacterium]|nr:alkaline phosphatase D family protein [Akkermansiaceae bacterium]